MYTVRLNLLDVRMIRFSPIHESWMRKDFLQSAISVSSLQNLKFLQNLKVPGA